MHRSAFFHDKKNKVIIRIRGGLGNQLFCYAAALRLAMVNNAELVIDNVTGFSRDEQYRRQYSLDHFQINERKATPAERLEPFERYRRCMAKYISRLRPFYRRNYLEQDGVEFDPRLLNFKVCGTIYLDGLWQSENYFEDVEKTLRTNLWIIPPIDDLNKRLAAEIRKRNAVAIHFRWFSAPASRQSLNVSFEYYNRAIKIIGKTIKSPHYYIFSDDPGAVREQLSLPDSLVTFVSHNLGDVNAYADLWLMTMCKHFIIANSTFSWWAAWLGGDQETIVICPNGDNPIAAWGIDGQIPDKWLKL